MTKTTVAITDLDLDALKGWLQSRLSEERLHHSLGAQQKAIELARLFKLTPIEIQKASVAGLLHDAAKLMTPDELLTAARTLDIELSPFEREAPQTLHPLVGAELVAMEFGIDDAEVLNAIRYHTTGRPGMSVVEKIVYLADKIEGNTRNPLYTQKINELLDFRDLKTLDTAVQFIMDSTITFLIEKGQIIHPRTIEARNDLVRIRKQAAPAAQAYAP